MIEKYSDGKIPGPTKGTTIFDVKSFWSHYGEALRRYDFFAAIKQINTFVAACDATITKEQPWVKAKKGEDISGLLYELVESLRHLGLSLLFVTPNTAEKILLSLGVDKDMLQSLDKETQWGKLAEGAIIKKGEILFPRLEKK